jgi:hypothetical protein
MRLDHEDVHSKNSETTIARIAHDSVNVANHLLATMTTPASEFSHDKAVCSKMTLCGKEKKLSQLMFDQPALSSVDYTVREYNPAEVALAVPDIESLFTN